MGMPDEKIKNLGGIVLCKNSVKKRLKEMVKTLLRRFFGKNPKNIGP